MKKWAQIDFVMESGEVVTSAWQETNVPLEDFNPLVEKDEEGRAIPVMPEPGQFIGFPAEDDPKAMDYVQILKIEAFRVTIVEADERPEEPGGNERPEVPGE